MMYFGAAVNPFAIWVTACGLAYAIPPYVYPREETPSAGARIYVKCTLSDSRFTWPLGISEATCPRTQIIRTYEMVDCGLAGAL
jgi:hypothetical protein